MQVIAQRGTEQFIVQEGQELQPGDALRFILRTVSAGYVSVFSIDANNNLSSFYPSSEPRTQSAPIKLERSGRHVLPGSIVLDNTRGKEHIFVIFSAQPFSRDEVQQKVQERVKREKETSLSANAMGIAGIISRLTIFKVEKGLNEN